MVNNTPAAWNSASGTWTCPRAGTYDISFGMMLDSHAAGSISGTEFAVIINHSGTIYIADYWPSTTATVKTPMTTVRAVLNCAVGDTVRPRIYQNLNGSAISIITGRNHFIINQLPVRSA